MGSPQHSSGCFSCGFFKFLYDMFCIYRIPGWELVMAAQQRAKPGPKPAWEVASMMTLRLDKNLQNAFDEVVSEQGKTRSEMIRDFMLQTVEKAGRTDLLKR